MSDNYENLFSTSQEDKYKPPVGTPETKKATRKGMDVYDEKKDEDEDEDEDEVGNVQEQVGNVNQLGPNEHAAYQSDEEDVLNINYGGGRRRKSRRKSRRQRKSKKRRGRKTKKRRCRKSKKRRKSRKS
jgi:hypothetical protein